MLRTRFNILPALGTWWNQTHFIALMLLVCESDLTEAEPVVVLLALFLLESKDQLSDQFRPGLCDQRLHTTDFWHQLVDICSVTWKNNTHDSQMSSNNYHHLCKTFWNGGRIKKKMCWKNISKDNYRRAEQFLAVSYTMWLLLKQKL